MNPYKHLFLEEKKRFIAFNWKTTTECCVLNKDSALAVAQETIGVH